MYRNGRNGRPIRHVLVPHRPHMYMCVPNLESVCTTHTLQTTVHLPTYSASECTCSMSWWNRPPKGSRRECTRCLRAHSRLDSNGSTHWHCKQPSPTDRLYKQSMAPGLACMHDPSHPLPSLPRLPRAVVYRGDDATSRGCKVVDYRVLRQLVDGERPCTILRAHTAGQFLSRAHEHGFARARHRISARLRAGDRSRNAFRF